MVVITHMSTQATKSRRSMRPASKAAAAMTIGCFFWRLRDAAARIERAGAGYAVALVAGAMLGGYAAGTANLWLSGEPGVARSIVGALAGGIAAIELYKRAITADPTDANANLNLGFLLYQTGDTAGADAAFRKAIALNPALKQRIPADQQPAS